MSPSFIDYLVPLFVSLFILILYKSFTYISDRRILRNRLSIDSDLLKFIFILLKNPSNFTVVDKVIISNNKFKVKISKDLYNPICENFIIDIPCIKLTNKEQSHLNKLCKNVIDFYDVIESNDKEINRIFTNNANISLMLKK